MPDRPTLAARRRLHRLVETAGCVLVGGLVFAAALWAPEPGHADPPASSWAPGRTSTTWDSERHWNYWTEWRCTAKRSVPGAPWPVCAGWKETGRVWKPCGPTISPPDRNRTNTCNIGLPGGHEPHGDGVNVKYTYTGRHEDRTSPTYPVCVDDPTLPPDTAPGNCGAWVTVPHDHCGTARQAHPPDCGTGTSPPQVSTTTTATPGGGLGPTTTVPVVTVPVPTSPPPVVPDGCEHPGAFDVFSAAVDARPSPGLGIRPAAYGYVRLPMRAAYAGPPSSVTSAVVDGDRVELRLWISRLTWEFTDLSTLDGARLGNRPFDRHAPNFADAPALTAPATVEIAGGPAVYPRSSDRAGYPAGYRIGLNELWRGLCRESGTTGWSHLGDRTRRFRFEYTVYEIRSRPY